MNGEKKFDLRLADFDVCAGDTIIFEEYDEATRQPTGPQTKIWNTASGSADAVSLDYLPTLRDRSRDLLRNAPLATGAVNTVITNVIGTGLKPQSHLDRDISKPYLKTDDAMKQ